MVASPEKIEFKTSAAPANSDRVAVLLMGYGEVESYDDFANYNEQALNLLTAKFAPVPNWIYPPLAKILAIFDLHEWSHQHGKFVSPHNAIFEQQRAGIEQNLQEKWGDKVKVFKAFNFCAPFLPEQVIPQIKAEGFDKILIYPLLVVDSVFTSGIAVEQVNNALAQTFDGKEHWVTGQRYIPSFYDEPAYIQLMADLVEEEIKNDLAVAHLPSQIGIVLMNHGCPHKAKGFTSGIVESQALYDRVRERLMYRYPLISVGWLNHDTPLIEWTQPDATLAAKNLIDLGATAIVFMPIGFATENHETLLDVDHIIEGLQKQRQGVTYRKLPCVNDHPEFLKMAAEWANPQIEALLSESAIAVNPNLVVRDHVHSHGDHGHNHGDHGHSHGDHGHNHGGHGHNH
ncbi:MULTISPECIES: ferrochelatase [unclassified Microcoleus]|uniref:ferrochelatase n=1 Tax=unclassified Microcoleus TaxID=2642155 RepID=UPI001D746CDD|nr:MULTISPECIES: ferrochelatase [unclassified Microcoleus]MCC3506667.1 ferrochelatase [Microcoleus sp. PH2017_19_SFW_U_A]TAE15455.1 MAG: ferrochelatase [Oscillatoriales cyanobacterium]MCC3410590.1 ferrochelatase [Microcoleus sp. PH2017_02_FOX_O_A]MCC3448820.1 ferrochelatase [Microcoleus sp. PH2017_09_SFU_O_A]MCC3473326.1 ferrochelatase [Microcoleus sp. PH2017_13_LAR_U_A]